MFITSINRIKTSTHFLGRETLIDLTITTLKKKSIWKSEWRGTFEIKKKKKKKKELKEQVPTSDAHATITLKQSCRLVKKKELVGLDRKINGFGFEERSGF